MVLHLLLQEPLRLNRLEMFSVKYCMELMSRVAMYQTIFILEEVENGTRRFCCCCSVPTKIKVSVMYVNFFLCEKKKCNKMY